jgi:hypothetical protein
MGVKHSSIRTVNAMHRAYMMYEAHAAARLLDRRVYSISLFGEINSLRSCACIRLRVGFLIGQLGEEGFVALVRHCKNLQEATSYPAQRHSIPQKGT